MEIEDGLKQEECLGNALISRSPLLTYVACTCWLEGQRVLKLEPDAKKSQIYRLFLATVMFFSRINNKSFWKALLLMRFLLPQKLKAIESYRIIIYIFIKYYTY